MGITVLPSTRNDWSSAVMIHADGGKGSNPIQPCDNLLLLGLTP